MKKLSLIRNMTDYFIVGIAVLMIISFVGAIYNLDSEGSDKVRVIYNNQLVKEMSLSFDEVFTLKQEDYPLLLGTMIIEVNQGKVRVKEEESPRNYCSLIGWVSQKGSSIICAPNNVVITIEGYVDPGFDFQIGGQ
jgi:hypothetical protein